MKNTQKIVLMTALLGASGLAFAGPEHRSHGSDARPSSQPAREFAGAIKQLDLSPDQQAEIESIFVASRDAMKAHAEASKALREDLRNLLNAPQLDEDALATLAEAEGDLAEERVMLMGTLAADVLAELDEEQRAELEELRAERLARRGERRQDRRGS